MFKRWFAILGVVALLSACAAPPPTYATRNEPWNGGLWNSMLGYHGPTNTTVAF